MKTKSEIEVEKYFYARGIEVEKIAEGADRSPDYRIVVDGVEVVVEVKQFDPTETEQYRLDNLEEGELLIIDATPGKGVRKKISDAASQLSRLAKDRCPAILILYNNRPFLLGNPANEYDIRVGMYGFETIVLVKGRDGQAPQLRDRKFGGSRKLTEQHNTTISAIAAMESREKGVVMRVYHNEYASIPLPLGLLAQYGAQEFILSNRVSGQFQEWVEINDS